MTHDEALGVREGDYITSKYTAPPLMPLRVRQVYQSPNGGIIRFRVGGLPASMQWLSYEAVNLPPVDHVWDSRNREWITTHEWKQRYPHTKPTLARAI